MKTKQKQNIVHIRKVDDLSRLDAAKSYTLLIYKPALDAMTEQDYLQILNLTAIKNNNLNQKVSRK